MKYRAISFSLILCYKFSYEVNAIKLFGNGSTFSCILNKSIVKLLKKGKTNKIFLVS